MIRLKVLYSDCLVDSMAISARIRSLTKRTPRNLERLASSAVAQVQRTMERHAALTVRKLQNDYVRVPELPSYKRTMDLKNSWEHPGNTPSLTRFTADGIVVSIQNGAVDSRGRHYAILVHGDESGNGQLSLHAGRGWRLMHDVIRDGYRDKIRATIKEAFKE